MNIVVIDYGLGNLRSVYNALAFLGADTKISGSPEDIENADKIVLPGVGAFPDAMSGLEKRGLVGPLRQFLTSGRAYLGICLGLQLLFESSAEGGANGLGVFRGKVRRFMAEDGIKVPHIGWNAVSCQLSAVPDLVGTPKNLIRRTAIRGSHKLMEGIKDGSYFYFDHSYYAEPVDKDTVAAITDYGAEFASFVRKDNIYAVQFHPERSQELGLRLLENFIKL
ncbi:MAG: imidazole glycerol phosphate synthase, glutamine amidotransferase subunit [Omnitrophica bacterium RBG_13_46_9]|nr:MAG: imidazole glycerol phosphate synthase, glutamine amidotransferase subunit [Omnitrophica bacterium RBG_13_46_9]